MSITLIADEETAGTLAGKLSQDPFFLSEGPVERVAFIPFYDSNTVEYLPAGFGPEHRDTLADIHPAATRTLRGVVQNTWPDNREDQLSEPLRRDHPVRPQGEVRNLDLSPRRRFRGLALQRSQLHGVTRRAGSLTRPLLRGLGYARTPDD